ncbi:MAG TPA: O-antigen ligase family protein [Alphaproteobacteria bacterium]|nr:O-antigen ligase family protein [Alphaproteobacteria bacterium]
MTFTIGAFPWHLLSAHGVAFTTQLGFLGLAATFFISRKQFVLLLPQFFLKYILILFSFWLVVLTFIVVSGSTDYGVLKALLLLTKGVLPLIALGILYPFDDKDICAIFFSIITGSLLMALNLLIFTEFDSQRATTDDHTNPIAIARTIGVGTTMLVLSALVKSNVSLIFRLFSIPLTLTMFLMIILTGSRGPLISILLSIPIILFFIEKGIKQKVLILLKILLTLLAIYSLIIFTPWESLGHSGLTRIIYYSSSFGENSSDLERIYRFHQAWDSFIKSNGLGVGTGGFARLYGYEDNAYPHNLILEVACEQGIIGLSLLVPLIFLPLLRLLSVSSRANCLYRLGILSIWPFSLSNAFVSGDIATNYILWVSGGLLLLLTPSLGPDYT